MRELTCSSNARSSSVTSTDEASDRVDSDKDEEAEGLMSAVLKDDAGVLRAELPGVPTGVCFGPNEDPLELVLDRLASPTKGEEGGVGLNRLSNHVWSSFRVIEPPGLDCVAAVPRSAETVRASGGGLETWE
jgi:hypothetical protein